MVYAMLQEANLTLRYLSLLGKEHILNFVKFGLSPVKAAHLESPERRVLSKSNLSDKLMKALEMKRLGGIRKSLLTESLPSF